MSISKKAYFVGPAWFLLNLVSGYSKGEIGSSFGGVLEPDGSEWHVGAVFSYPIGNLAALSALSQARIEHASLRRQRLQTERDIEFEVSNAVIKIEKSLVRRNTLKSVLDQAKQLEAVAKARFARGLATNLDVTDAQADIRDAETDILNASVDYNIGLAELEAATGGPI